MASGLATVGPSELSGWAEDGVEMVGVRSNEESAPKVRVEHIIT